MARPSEDNESTTKLMPMEVTETSCRSQTHGISHTEARHITVGDNCQHAFGKTPPIQSNETREDGTKLVNLLNQYA